MNICKLFLLLTGFTLSFSLHAEWKIATHTNIEKNSILPIAQITNETGYTLEIYKDENDVVRSRFRLNDVLDKLAGKSCPTYQIDQNDFVNRSVNDAKCISTSSWAEFILGYIVNNEIKSTYLHHIMNGNSIKYRFILTYGGYGETAFSLDGSKKVIMTILGSNISVITAKGFSN